VTREQLEHAVRAACDVARDTELYIFGSQAVLGQHPDAPEALRQSVEVDVSPKNNPDMADAIDAAIGELSRFHDQFGFYVHGLNIEAVTLPENWQDRTVRVQSPNTQNRTGWCLEAHDLAASKLAAFRDKDREFVRILLVNGMLTIDVLLLRVRDLPIDAETIERLTTWVTVTGREIAGG
jgi:hypothetical protein